MQARLHPALALLCLFPLLLTAQSADILVSSRNTNSVKRYSFDGSYLGDFIMPNAGALTNPQDLLWLPDGSLLVTGIGNSAIKHYDGSSGTFLGNFSSGYNLDRPTKMSVGPDGALYVSQWGSTQNKIARFNLQTGVFIDEFTETGVPQGCGHYWDADGNLYVASFGQGTNGNVHRFAPDGSFLGIAINSAHLQGPVGMWVDENGDFMITDWTLGQVLRFGATGLAYEGVFISGMQNIEGFLIDDGRFIYLCDWTANLIRRFQPDGQGSQIFTSAGGMQAPNALAFFPVANGAGAPAAPAFGIDSIFPNPLRATATIRFTLPSATSLRLDILSTDGQVLATLAKGHYTAGPHEVSGDFSRLPDGSYLCRLQAYGREKVTKAVVRR